MKGCLSFGLPFFHIIAYSELLTCNYIAIFFLRKASQCHISDTGLDTLPSAFDVKS